MNKRNPRTVRLDEDLDSQVQQWLEINEKVGIDFSRLVNLAVKEFIASPQSVEFEPIAFKEGVKTAKAAMKKHRKAVDELK